MMRHTYTYSRFKISSDFLRLQIHMRIDRTPPLTDKVILNINELPKDSYHNNICMSERFQKMIPL